MGVGGGEEAGGGGGDHTQQQCMGRRRHIRPLSLVGEWGIGVGEATRRWEQHTKHEQPGRTRLSDNVRRGGMCICLPMRLLFAALVSDYIATSLPLLLVPRTCNNHCCHPHHRPCCCCCCCCCCCSFSFGAASLVYPGLGFDASFLEEPVMLLAFVLLGRAMEARAKVVIVLLSLFGVTAFEESILCLVHDSSVCFCSPLPWSSNYAPPLPPMGGPGWGGGCCCWHLYCWEGLWRHELRWGLLVFVAC